LRTLERVDFYGRKPASLPRFVYRRLATALQDPSTDRGAAIDAAVTELLSGEHPDLRKFKFTLPDFLRKLLTPDEAKDMLGRTAARRDRARSLKMVFPHVSDEFSLDPDFLATALDLDHGPALGADARFFTVGSCFARNIAEFLTRNGRQAHTFSLAEDLNSPISNAFIFDVLGREPQAQVEALTAWTQRLFPELAPGEAERAATQKQQEMMGLKTAVAQADCVILTLGNVVDFFLEDSASPVPLMDKVAPKFIAMPSDENIEVRASAAARLKKLGATLRMASHEETREAIAGCIQGIRAMTAAPIVVTLSPVPVDSAIGLSSDLRSAVEVDCVSKSRLRCAFDEVAQALRAQGAPIHYFPSFEIVRWIAPLLPIPSFGMDDAAARHVSSPILDAVCALFIQRFVRPDPTPQA
jgi:hypothetical protein